jgi:hypothetical protein
MLSLRWWYCTLTSLFFVSTILGEDHLYEDAEYRFAFKFSFERKWYLLHLGVKRANGHFLLRLGKKWYQVDAGNPADLERESERLAALLKQHLETEFERFLQGEKSELGLLALASKSDAVELSPAARP